MRSCSSFRLPGRANVICPIEGQRMLTAVGQLVTRWKWPRRPLPNGLSEFCKSPLLETDWSRLLACFGRPSHPTKKGSEGNQFTYACSWWSHTGDRTRFGIRLDCWQICRAGSVYTIECRFVLLHVVPAECIERVAIEAVQGREKKVYHRLSLHDIMPLDHLYVLYGIEYIAS